MTGFDWVVIGIVVASAVLGLWRGVVGEVLALASWVVAFLAARAWGAEVGHALFGMIGDASVRVIVGWVAVFVATLLVVGLGRVVVRTGLKVMGLGFVDRLLGTFFGLARGVVIVLLMVAVGGMTSAPKQVWWREARFAPPLETAVLAAKPWLPPEIAKHIRFQ